MAIKDIGILCSHCKRTFEMPRHVIIEMYRTIMSYSPLPTEELELFKELRDLEVIFDVGARTDTEYLDLRPDAEHHLFEPNPVFFKELEMKVGNKPNVFANNFGLGDKEEGRGYYSPLQGFLGSGSVPEDAIPDCNLSLKTLGWYFEEKGLKKIDFLKIDTEGHDLKVIIGAYNWRDKIRFIQYEHWGEHNNKMIKGLLCEEFDIENVGYRNMFCKNRSLVSEEERNRLKIYIKDNKLGELV